MTTRHVCAITFTVGIGLVCGAVAMDKRSDFEDGSFIGQILLGLLGALMMVGSVLVAIFA